ncbi:hypothetical protein Dimus_011335 [Dionaea muscipula]
MAVKSSGGDSSSVMVDWWQQPPGRGGQRGGYESEQIWWWSPASAAADLGSVAAGLCDSGQRWSMFEAWWSTVSLDGGEELRRRLLLGDGGLVAAASK